MLKFKIFIQILENDMKLFCFTIQSENINMDILFSKKSYRLSNIMCKLRRRDFGRRKKGNDSRKPREW